MAAMSAVLLYQATNPAIYYCIGMGVWTWAFCEGEAVAKEAWTLPKRMSTSGKV